MSSEAGRRHSLSAGLGSFLPSLRGRLGFSAVELLDGRCDPVLEEVTLHPLASRQMACLNIHVIVLAGYFVNSKAFLDGRDVPLEAVAAERVGLEGSEV
jgi:hypothetical protein